MEATLEDIKNWNGKIIVTLSNKFRCNT